MADDGCLESVEKCVGERVTASVIWLHGLGADGHDFVPIVDELRQAADIGVRFVFPHAPVQPVTVNGGMAMRAWYDILGLGEGLREDERGLREARGHVERLLARERARGIPAERTLLAGFSQGAATALYTAVQADPPPAGLIALSGWMPASTPVAGATQPLAVFMAHGAHDPLVPAALGRAASQHLVEAGHTVEWQEYPMEHAVCLPEIERLDAWLAECFSSS